MAPADAAVEAVEAWGGGAVSEPAGGRPVTSWIALVLDAVAEAVAAVHVPAAHAAAAAAGRADLPAVAVEGVVEVAGVVGAVVAA